jgi:protein-disulfide isomerase
MSKLESDEGDLTRKQRREQAREERKAAEQAAAAGDARRKRMTQLGGAVAVVIVAIVVILVATGGGGKKAAPKPGAKNSATQKALAEVTSTIGGVPQKGNVLGSPTAPVTLQYFGDLECPFCREFTTSVLPTVIKKFVRSGKLQIQYRSLETATREPEVFTTQQTAALAAGKQNKMWWFVELFYHLQGEEDSGYVTESYLQGLAAAVPGLSLSQWTTDRSDQTLQAQVETDTQEANNVGFTGTPSFLIGQSGGAMKKLEASEYGNSFSDPSAFASAIEKHVKA